MAKMSKRASQYISRKISKIRREGKSMQQAIAMAYSMARQKGFKVSKGGR